MDAMDHEQSRPRPTSAAHDLSADTTGPRSADSTPQETRRQLTEARRLTRQRRFTKIAFWLLVPAVLVWLAPAIVAHTSLRTRLLNAATSSLDGEVSVGRMSLGWLSPVRLYDLSVVDSAGDPLAKVETITTQRTLLGLLLHRRDPGTIRVEQPVARLVLRKSGSNWEDLLAKQLNGPSSGQATQLTIEIVDGSLELADATTDQRWTLASLDATIRLPDHQGPLEADLSGELIADDSRPSAISAAVRYEAGQGKATIQTTTFPLHSLNPVFRRLSLDSVAEGTVDLDGDYSWGIPSSRSGTAAPAHQLSVRKLQGSEIVINSAAWGGQDALRLPMIEAHGEIDWRGSVLELRNVKLESPVASIDADGTLSCTPPQPGAANSQLWAVLENSNITARGEVDLAQLAQLFPQTLRIREGTEITSGKLLVELTSGRDDSRRNWQGRVSSSQLTAVTNGRSVTWEQPIQLDLVASQGPQGPVIEKLECRSSFLQAAAQGTPTAGRLTLTGDLNRLADELSQFLDLGATRLAGQLRGDLNWKVDPQDRASAHGEFHVTQLELVLGQQRPWREPALSLVADTQATLSANSLDTVHSATLRVVAGDDTLDLELTAPVRSPDASTTWPLAGRLRGALDRWLPRVQSFLPLAGWELAGTADITAQGHWHPDQIELTSAQSTIRNLEAVGGGLFVREPQVQLELQAQWDRTRRVCQAPSVTFTSSSLAFRADQVTWRGGDTDSPASLSANIGLRSDLARLGAWFHDPQLPVDWQLAGMASGQVRLTHAADTTTAQWGLDFQNLVYARAATPDRPRGAQVIPASTAPALETTWTEPQLQWSGEGSFDSTRGTFQLKQSQLAGDGLRIALAGDVADLTRSCQVAFDGELAYDLPRLVTRLRPHVGPSLQLEGTDTRPFSVRGPLRNLQLATGTTRLTSTSPQESGTWPPSTLAAQAGVNWKSAALYGLPIGPGQLDARLDRSVLVVQPLDIPVADGHLRFAPRIHWDQPEPVAVAEPGVALERVRLSPELCASWLKYLLPVLADVTEAQGQFSVELTDAAVVPLQRPEDGEIRGNLAVHGVQIGPSPLTNELIGLAQTIKAIADGKASSETAPSRQWLQLPEQAIPFHWKQRRVYHERLEINLKDVSIVTGGSVGSDQSLSLMAEIPIRDEWVARNRYLASLQGQKLQIPVTGTLARPQVDRRVLQNLTTQAVTNSANRLIEQELNRGIDRFLRPRTPAGQTPAAPGQTPAPAPAAPAPAAPGPGSLPFPLFPSAVPQGQP
ncbi:MAG: hypothetical protein U0935_07910 [Pirellulales bacterium]